MMIWDSIKLYILHVHVLPLYMYTCTYMICTCMRTRTECTSFYLLLLPLVLSCFPSLPLSPLPLLSLPCLSSPSLASPLPPSLASPLPAPSLPSGVSQRASLLLCSDDPLSLRGHGEEESVRGHCVEVSSHQCTCTCSHTQQHSCAVTSTSHSPMWFLNVSECSVSPVTMQHKAFLDVVFSIAG